MQLQEFFDYKNQLMEDLLTSESIVRLLDDDISMDDGQLKRARNICIPIISENGFMYRFGDRNPSEENDDIYGELFECTYDGDFYSMFYEYGIGKVVRTKLR